MVKNKESGSQVEHTIKFCLKNFSFKDTAKITNPKKR